MPKSVYIVNTSGPYAQMYLNRGWEITSTFECADLIQFTGGEDVTPSLYGSKRHYTTQNNVSRDAYEESKYLEARDLNIPMAGICRGGQFLNVMCGGRMFQDVDGHCGNHDLVVEGRTIFVSSTHHQEMIPGAGATKVIQHVSDKPLRKVFVDDAGYSLVTKSTLTTEIVLYEDSKVLCFQPHPEFAGLQFDDLKYLYFDCLESIL